MEGELVTGTLVAADRGVSDRKPVVRDPLRRRGWPWGRLPAHWPLTVALLGFPLWWALGLRTILPMLMTVFMADQLLRRRRLALPVGFTLWALFLVWVAFGVFVLWVDAPGAVPGGGASRLVVFGYRMAWYLTATVLLLWVANLRESQLPTRWVVQLLGYMFVITAAGGLAGVLWPTFEFRSLVELALPGGLRSNGLVQAIVHPALADVQNVLGRPQARPKAPFPYSNSWGSNLALFLPFFVVAWVRDGSKLQRAAAPVVLAVAAVPVVYSLNRGLWACLVLGAVGLVLLQVRKGRATPILVVGAGVAFAALLFAASPLSTVVVERFENQHSNERRTQLLSQTVSSVVEGSPVVGFGSTRDVQGSFASIAGGSTPDCSACGVPPLGTQGHAWLVLFSQGLVGAALFATFFLLALSRTWRCRTVTETLCTFVLVFFGFQVLIYDTLGTPLYVVMIAIALVAREQRATSQRTGQTWLHDALRRLRLGAPVLVATTLVGSLAGTAVAVPEPRFQASRVSILLTQAPVYLSTSDLGDEAALPREVTIDTEAALIVSRRSLSRVVGGTDPERLAQLRDRVRVTAPENTRVLTIEVRDPDARQSQLLATSLAGSYLLTRRDYLSNRRDQSLAILRKRLNDLTQPGVEAESFSVASTRQRVEEALTQTLFTPTSAGDVIRTSPPRPVRRQSEVPVATGAALGLLAGTLALVVLPAWRPRWPVRRGRAS